MIPRTDLPDTAEFLALLRSRNPVLALQQLFASCGPESGGLVRLAVRQLVREAVRSGQLVLSGAQRQELARISQCLPDLLVEIPEATDLLPPGEALGLLVAGGQGYVCPVRVFAGDPQTPGALPDGALGQALLLGKEAAERWQRRFLGRERVARAGGHWGLCWQVELPVPLDELRGHSLSLAAALAYLSLLLGHGLRRDCLATGVLDPASGRIGEVDGLEAKREAVRREGGPSARLLCPGAPHSLHEAIRLSFADEALEELRWRTELGEQRWMVVSCGTSLLGHYRQSLAEEEQKETDLLLRRLREVPAAVRVAGEEELHDSMLRWALRESGRATKDSVLTRLSAELATLLALTPQPQPQERIVLLASDSGDGRLLAEVVAELCRWRFLVEPELETIEGLSAPGGRQSPFRSKGLPALVQRLTTLVRQSETADEDPEVLLVATAGFKPFHSYMMIAGMLLRVSVLYLAEDRDLLHFPPLELQWSRELWERNRELLDRLARGEALTEQELSRGCARAGDPDRLRPLLEQLPAGAARPQLVLSAAGLAFCRANELGAHRRDPRLRLLLTRSALEEMLTRNEGRLGLLLLAEPAGHAGGAGSEIEGLQLRRLVRLIRRCSQKERGQPADVFRLQGRCLAVPVSGESLEEHWLSEMTRIHARLEGEQQLRRLTLPPAPAEQLLALAEAWAEERAALESWGLIGSQRPS